MQLPMRRRVARGKSPPDGWQFAEQPRRLRDNGAELALVPARPVGSGPKAQKSTARLIGLGPVAPASRARGLAHNEGAPPNEDSELDSSVVASSTGSRTSTTDSLPLGSPPRTFFAQQSLQR
eukprot:10934098-Heterocapsa_arctica.AAC.1